MSRQRLSATQKILWLISAAMACHALPTAKAQVGAVGSAGVYIDVDGVLRARETDHSSKLAMARRAKDNRSNVEDSGLCYISLPRLFEAVQAKLDAGERVPDSMRFLDGMVKLRYVFVFPNEKDVVIAGPADSFDATNDPRPLGKATHRPLLRLDDLVVALRTVGPGQRSMVFGCSLDMEPGANARMQSAAREIGAVTRGQYNHAARLLIDAIGPQHVRFYGVQPDSPFAYVCIEADYIMKRLALGLAKPPFAGFRSHLSMLKRGEGIYHRFWFVPYYEPLLVSPDGNSYEIRGQALAVRASDSPTDDTPPSGSGAQFAEQMTKDFPRLAESIGSFADLWNITDLAIASALIGVDEIDRKIGWDLSWVLASGGYVVPKVPVPKTAEPLGNYRVAGRTLLLSGGGVTLDMHAPLKRRDSVTQGATALTSLSRRPEAGKWSRRAR